MCLYVLCVCLSVCLSVCEHKNSKTPSHRIMKFERIQHSIVYENISDKIGTGHDLTKVKVTTGIWTVLKGPIPSIK